MGLNLLLAACSAPSKHQVVVFWVTFRPPQCLSAYATWLRTGAVLSLAPVVTYALSGWTTSAIIMCVSTHFARPWSYHLIPSRHTFIPSHFSSFQPSFPRPRLFAHAPEDVIRVRMRNNFFTG